MCLAIIMSVVPKLVRIATYVSKQILGSLHSSRPPDKTCRLTLTTNRNNNKAETTIPKVTNDKFHATEYYL